MSEQQAAETGQHGFAENGSLDTHKETLPGMVDVHAAWRELNVTTGVQSESQVFVRGML
jgi:hypothetical protein